MNNTTKPDIDLLTKDDFLSVFWPVVDHPFGHEALIFLHVVTMMISIPGNSLTALIIIRKSSLRDEPAYLLICSVSCADFMVSMVAQPLNIFALAARTHIGPTSETFLYFTIWGFCGASAFGVVFITVDRFICITYPMQYTTLLNKQRTFYLIAAQWICGIAYGSLPLMNLKQSVFPTATASLITILGMTVVMFYIYSEVYKNIKRLRNGHVKTSKEKQHNATLTIALIVLAFFVCWFPYIVTNFVIAKERLKPGSPVFGLYYWFLGLGCWNSALNVIIYGLKNVTIRREVRKLLRIRGNKTANQYTSKVNGDEDNYVSVPSTSMNETIACGLKRANITLFCVPIPHNGMNHLQTGSYTTRATSVTNNHLSDIPEEPQISKSYLKTDNNNNNNSTWGKKRFIKIYPFRSTRLHPGIENKKITVPPASARKTSATQTGSLSPLFQAAAKHSNQRKDSELSDASK